MYKKIFLKLRTLLKTKNKVKFKSIGGNVKIDSDCYFSGSENISIGNNVYIGFNCLFIGHGGIRIGSGTIISHKVEILTRNHNYNSDDLQAIPYDGKYDYKPVTIGENVWIGSNVLIVPGVTIGEGAVIGMGSVITKDIPEYAVAGGNPARILKYRNKEVYEKLKADGKIYLKLKND